MRYLWVLAVLLLPVAAAQESSLPAGIWNPDASTPVQLYFHLTGIQDMPINTQPPAAGYQTAQALGLATHSQGCIEIPATGILSSTHHTTYGYVTPGPVEYGEGKPRTHAERGLAQDLILDRSVTPMLDWYVESQIFAGNTENPVPDTQGIAPVVPKVVLRATIREGADISVDHTAMNTGRIVAQGFAGPVTLHPLLLEERPDVDYANVDGRHVYGFHVPLQWGDVAVVPEQESFNVRIDLYMENPACNDAQNDAYLMADWLRTHTSDGHRPGLAWAIHNPLTIKELRPVIRAEDVAVHAAFTSPWGQYDLDTQSVVARLDGGVVTPKTVNLHTNECGVRPDTTLSWDLPRDEGMHVFEVVARNAQGTAVTSGKVAFDVGDQAVTRCTTLPGGTVSCELEQVTADAEESPGLPLVGLLSGLAAVAMLRRRVH